MGNVVVSSSEIRRRLLEEGNVAGAATQLGYYYGLTATVVEGAGRGRTIGFPTANLQPTHPGKLIPANGVYAVRVRIDGESDFRVGMMNIGRRPTFEDSGRHLEVHIIDFDAPIYGRRLRVEFLERIRSERKFDNIEELSAQLRADRARCMALVGSESWKED
jgi:riboflavin kinase/FMN adenylyltransferase